MSTEAKEVLTYANPRMEAVINDWPSGSHRVQARFWVQVTNRGERACRTTANPKTGKPCAPKILTYAQRMRIVDGSDGKIYIIEDNSNYGHITVMQSNLQYNHETIHRGEPRHSEVMALFDYAEFSHFDMEA